MARIKILTRSCSNIASFVVALALAATPCVISVSKVQNVSLSNCPFSDVMEFSAASKTRREFGKILSAHGQSLDWHSEVDA